MNKFVLIIIALIVLVLILFKANGYQYNEKSIPSSESNLQSLKLKIIYHYNDSFSTIEKEKLENWLNHTTAATQELLGKYPFDVHYYFNRRDNASEPVPWAHTERSSIQGVKFHVDPDYPLDAFMSDWTAPHEISHLAIPFLGKSNSWFAEGFATFMQNEILLEMGEYTKEDVQNKYKNKLDMALPYYERDEPFAEVAMDLRKSYNFPQMYWGGAYFFIQLDEKIRSMDGISLCELIQKYQPCCRLEDQSIEDVLQSLDRLSSGNPASELMTKFKTLPAKEVID